MTEKTKHLLEIMTDASGLTAERILSRSRQRPLPAVRWMIGRELIRHGYSSNVASRELNINHATLLHGCKMLGVMKDSRRNWTMEIEIEERYTNLLQQQDNGTT